MTDAPLTEAAESILAELLWTSVTVTRAGDNDKVFHCPHHSSAFAAFFGDNPAVVTDVTLS